SRMLAAFTLQTGALAATDVVSGAVLFRDHAPFGHVDLVADVEFGLAGAVAAPVAGALRAGANGLAPPLGAGRAQAGLRGVADGAPAVSVLPPRLQRVVEESTAVPAGRSFFLPRRDPWLAAMAPLVRPRPGTAVVFAHGTTTTVIASGTVLTPRELAEIIRADQELSERPLRLFACRTGRADDGFAHQLAQELGVDVTAPTELAWLGPDGAMSTTSGRLVRDNWVQTVPHDGTWRTFAPRAR
ncbi:MAG TPA: hypothetical protein VMT69_16085, partial [Kineosporiaceae bacterium]|nr:hypothetical protein [Kineosporiaceae bacterium]